MDLLDLRELADDEGESIVKILLSKFHLAHVEVTNPRDLIPSVNYSWRFSLSFG